MINPNPAYEMFSEYLFKENFCIQSIHAKTIGTDNVRYQIFSEYGLDSPINFRVIQWHNYFDALIGSSDFARLKAKIDYHTNTITLGDKKIPFYFHSPFKQKHHEIEQNSHDLTIPVNIKQGEVYVPAFIHDGHYFPDAILVAEEYAVKYPTECFSEVEFDQPVYVEPLDSVDVQSLEINSITERDIGEFLRTQHMNDLETEAIFNVCSEFADVFYFPGCDLSFTNSVKHYIRTTDESPVYKRNYRYPPHLKDLINKEVQKLLNQGIITHSESPYCRPVWIVPKKTDASGERKWRLVIDFRDLNKKTIEDKYPLPRIEEILDSLGKCQYLVLSIWHKVSNKIEMDPRSIEKTAFTVDNHI